MSLICVDIPLVPVKYSTSLTHGFTLGVCVFCVWWRGIIIGGSIHCVWWMVLCLVEGHHYRAAFTRSVCLCLVEHSQGVCVCVWWRGIIIGGSIHEECVSVSGGGASL